MQDDAEDGFEEYHIVVTISDMHTDGVAIDRSSITANLGIDDEDMKDGDGEESDNSSKKKSSSKSHDDGVH